MQDSEITFFCISNVDFHFRLWYDKYVGRPVGCSFVFCRSGAWTAKEMTLDCLFFLRTSFSVKGHFCSFLLSNIIGYLAFLNLDFFLFDLFIISFSDSQELPCLISSADKIVISLSLSVLDLILSSFGICPVFDSRCYRNLFWSVDFSPDLNDFSFFSDSGYMIFFILFWSTFCVLPVSVFWKKYRCSTHFWFLWDLNDWLSLVMFSHLYDFSFLNLFYFLLWVCKDLIFQLLESCILSFHFCHKWFDCFLLCCLISSLLYIWYHMLFHFATRNIVQTK